MRRWGSPEPAPVSYTHLDVYKRQGLHGAGKAAAVNADSARAVQEMLCGGNGHSGTQIGADVLIVYVIIVAVVCELSLIHI